VVVRPKKISAPILLSLKLSCFFFLTLCATLLAAPAIAAPEAPPALGELCVLPALGQSIAHYRELAAQGGWPQVPAGPTLHPGDQNERIPLLKKRLVTSNDLAASADQGALFDETLKEAVQKFQARHGLTADGVVGDKTLTEINVPVSERIRQLLANLERCQPLPQTLERRHILVNIADFSLKLFESDKLRLSMPVIVGKTYLQTPVFSGRVSSLVINPTWEVPHSIAIKDILPKIRKNPGYLAKMHLRVFQGWKGDEAIDPSTIDWAGLSRGRFPYRFSQDSGPDNALGRLKFLFPNPYDVYMHDTPAHELFQKDSRTFSHGCIRLSRPMDLALYLLQGTPLGTREALTAAIASEKTERIALPSPIDVYIVYMTAWVDHDGTIEFRPDVYHRNPALQ
jgi:murein L,D-transpeptidase YcbB/YkuD